MFNKTEWQRRYRTTPHGRAAMQRDNNSPECRARKHQYAMTPRGKALHAANRRNNMAAYKARMKADNAIRDGRLIRQPCEICGCRDVEAHHDDYAKPLAVRWLCKQHHEDYHHKVIAHTPRSLS